MDIALKDLSHGYSNKKFAHGYSIERFVSRIWH